MQQAASCKGKGTRSSPTAKGEEKGLHNKRIEAVSPAGQRKVHIQEEEHDVGNMQAMSCGQAEGVGAAASSTTGRLLGGLLIVNKPHRKGMPAAHCSILGYVCYTGNGIQCLCGLSQQRAAVAWAAVYSAAMVYNLGRSCGSYFLAACRKLLE